MSIKHRIRQLIKQKNITLAEFADKIGTHQSSISRALSESGTFGEAMINKVVLAYDVNKTWLLTGEGEMLKEDVGESDSLAGIPVSDYNASFINTPYVPIHAAAGFALGYGDSVYEASLVKMPVMVDREFKGKYFIFEVSGDSMTDGSLNSICDRDKILVREVKKEFWKSKLHIKKWNFVIAHAEYGIVVKQIKDHNVETGEITCHSLNAEYDDFTWNLKDITGIFNVVKIIERTL